jgi:hypothetical protein
MEFASTTRPSVPTSIERVFAGLFLGALLIFWGLLAAPIAMISNLRKRLARRGSAT